MQNDMRDRLIELLQNAPCDYDGNRGVGTIADHLIANGVVVLSENQIVIERKIVYYLFPIDCEKCLKATKEYDGVCKELALLYLGKHPKYNKKQDWEFMCKNCPHEILEKDYTQNDLSRIGKDVFLTKEQAEQKLKELSDNA